MNKFRNSLHSAFFFEDDLSASKEEYYTSKEYLDKQNLEKGFQKEEEEVREEVQEKEFPNLAGEVVAKMPSRYTDMEQLKRDRTRFLERVKSKDKKGKVYEELWNKRITEGFGFLKTSLKENGYFEGKNEQEELAKIKERYTEEIYSQYEKYIWDAGNKTFNTIKDSIFGPNAEEYPAEKIYKELTGATTISRIDRTYIEGYDADIVDWTDIEDDKEENINDRKNRNFLSDDLPEYLWNIRKTPGVLNVMKWLPIFTVKEDRPSKVDRKAIRQFLKVSSKIKIEGDEDRKALVLMEVFRESSLNTSSGKEDYKVALAKHGVSVEDKYIDDIIKAGSFYINTQKFDASAKDQHAVYLSVLKIIESEGGAKKAVDKFKSIVEQGKKDKKTEKKEGYETGEKLESTNPELYKIAKKLGIVDFASATRLSEKTSEYFANTPVEKILANLNNDRTIDARDTMVGGSKSGTQFLEIFKQVSSEIGDKKVINETTGEEAIIKGSDIVLNNLLERAKLDNKVLGLSLDESKFTKEEIQNGNTELILLLQNIISKPGEDLYTLLSGHSENPFEGLDLVAEKASADKAAAEIINKMDKEALKKDGLTLPTPESMQSGLSTALYTEYKRGIGLGGKVPFDQWIKGLELNTGFQVRNDGTVIVGIGLDYSKKIDLGKGWSTTPELSAGAFIPLGMGKIEEISGSAGVNDEVAKERITKKGIKQHLGVQGGVTLMPAGVLVLSAGFKWERDKAAGIESAEQKKMVEFRDEIISPLLDDVALSLSKKGKTKLDFDNDPEVIDLVKNDLRVNANKLIKSDELAKFRVKTERAEAIENVVNATTRLLLNYNNADLSQEGVKDLIAQGVSEQYAMAWAEDRKAHVSDTTYLSGASLGTFWVIGSPLVGIYAGIKFTKHNLDGYGDKRGNEQEIKKGSKEEWDKEMLDSLNQQLGLSNRENLRVENGLIVIPANLKHRANVNIKMKGLMKKDENGNVLIHKQTPMAVDVKRGASIQGSELIIGGRKGGQYEKLDTLGDERFTSEDIKENDILELSGVVSSYNLDILNKALEELKTKFPEGDPIKHLDFSMVPNVQDIIDKLNALDKTKKAKLSLITNEKGEIEIQDPVEGEEGRGLEVKYQAKAEMIDSQVRDVTESVYAEADKVTCNVLNLMCHHLKGYKDRRWPEYMEFAKAMNNQDYKVAKPLILTILRRLDTEINKQQKNNPVNFSEVATKIEAMTDDISLGQALMSVNNIFARSIKVVGKGQEEIEGKKISKYGLTLPMGKVIKEREDQIRGTVSDKVKEPGRSAYLALIDASKKYRLANEKIFNVKESKAAQLNNTVGFNLGNSVNPENPLFNPEIFAQMVDLKDLEKFGFNAEQRNALHERAMRLFAENSALINPVLKALGLEGKHVNIKEFSKNGEKGKLVLDIGEGNDIKRVTLNAGMKFGYFTQCVNHTVILDDISAETEDGTTVTFNSGVWENGRYVEGNKSTILSTTEVGGSVSVVIGKEKEKEEEDKPSTEPGEEEEDIPDNPNTIPGEEEEEIPGDGGSTPGADDGGKVNTGDPKDGEGGQTGEKGGGRDGENGGGTTPQQGGEGQTGGGSGGRDD